MSSEPMSSQCELKDRCGSCTWSHIPYQQQLADKLTGINAALSAADLGINCNLIVPSPRESHYRNRMDFAIDFEGRFGLREKGKWWRVIDGHKCFISDHKIEQLYDVVKAWIPEAGLSFFDRKRHTGLLRYALIRSSAEGQALVMIISSKPEHHEQAAQVKAALENLAARMPESSLVWGINSTPSDTSFADQLETISGKGYIEEQVLDWRYRISPNAFFQTNSLGAAKLLECVLEFAGREQVERSLDLFCGTGFFTIAMSSLGKAVHGVELNPDSIRDAQINAQINRSSATFELLKSEDFKLHDFAPQTLVLDPPRSGLHKDLLAAVQQGRIPQIIYVSCNYERFVEELRQLRGAYEAIELRAIDLFPHTPHVELVALLRARK